MRRKDDIFDQLGGFPGLLGSESKDKMWEGMPIEGDWGVGES